jgi:hypothetical protein
MRKYANISLPIYEEAVCNCCIQIFLIFEKNFIFFFISALTELQLLEGGGQAGDGRLSHAVRPTVSKGLHYLL